MAYDFKPFEARIAKVQEQFGHELSGIRTGRATASILDVVQVESYGTRMPVNNVATLMLEDARTLRIKPFDPGTGKEIEKAITQANLGLSVTVDDGGLRVIFPELTGERRIQLVKLAKEKMEEARTHVRQARDEVWSNIQAKEREGEISEDDKFRFKDEMQKKVDAANAAFEESLGRKEKEITG